LPVKGYFASKKRVGDAVIAFVGISRAMRQLYLTYSHTYTGRPVKRSPFLEEMFKGSAE
jgi:superfamily I DNA/RNA helicase